MKMNIREIAQLAGVSPATVSLALNNKKGVSDTKRAEILNLAKEYGYEKKPQVRKPKTAEEIHIVRCSTDGDQDIGNLELYSQLISHLYDICITKNYRTNITMCNELNFQKNISKLANQSEGGIVLIGTTLTRDQMEYLEQQDFSNVPLVVIDNSMLHKRICSVSGDDYNASDTALQYLHKKGVRSVGYLKCSTRFAKFCDRERGFRDFSEKLGIRNDLCFSLSTSINSMYAQMRNYFSSLTTFPEAFYAESSVLSIVAVRVLNELKKRVPEDIEIISGDDLLLRSTGLSTIPAITSAYGAMCQIAISTIENKLKRSDTRSSVEHISLSNRLAAGFDPAYL